MTIPAFREVPKNRRHLPHRGSGCTQEHAKRIDEQSDQLPRAFCYGLVIRRSPIQVTTDSKWPVMLSRGRSQGAICQRFSLRATSPRSPGRAGFRTPIKIKEPAQECRLVDQEFSAPSFVDSAPETISVAIAQCPLDARVSQQVWMTLNERVSWKEFANWRKGRCDGQQCTHHRPRSCNSL